MIASKKGEMMDPVRRLLPLTFMSCDLRLLTLYHQLCFCLAPVIVNGSLQFLQLKDFGNRKKKRYNIHLKL